MRSRNWMFLGAIGGVLLVGPVVAAPGMIASTDYVDRNIGTVTTAVETAQSAAESAAADAAAAATSAGVAQSAATAADTRAGTAITNAAAAQSTADANAVALGAKANDADLATVAKTGAYGDLTGAPTLGTAAAAATTDFATAAQGALATTAVQPAAITDMETKTDAAATYATKTELGTKANDADLATVAKTGSYTDLANTPTLGTAAVAAATDFATAAQGALAATAVQPAVITDMETKTDAAATYATKTELGTKLDTVTATTTYATKTELGTKANDADLATVAKTGAYGDLTGAPTLGTAAVAAATDFATAAQGALAATAVQPAVITDMETKTDAAATYATKTELGTKQNQIGGGTVGTVVTNSGTAGTVNSLAVDAAPTAASTNLVTSGGVQSALAAKLDAATAATTYLPAQPSGCSDPINKCVLVSDGTILTWEVIAR